MLLSLLFLGAVTPLCLMTRSHPSARAPRRPRSRRRRPPELAPARPAPRALPSGHRARARQVSPKMSRPRRSFDAMELDVRVVDGRTSPSTGPSSASRVRPRRQPAAHGRQRARHLRRGWSPQRSSPSGRTGCSRRSRSRWSWMRPRAGAGDRLVVRPRAGLEWGSSRTSTASRSSQCTPGRPPKSGTGTMERS